MSLPLLDLGDGIEVRFLEPSDAEDVFAVIDANRDRLRPWMPWVDPTLGPADTRAFIDRVRATGSEDGLGIYVDGSYAGGIGLRPDEVNGDVGDRLLDRRGTRGTWAGHPRVPCADRSCVRRPRAASRDDPRGAGQRAQPGDPRTPRVHGGGVLREAGKSALGHHDLVVYGLLDREWSAS